MNDEKFHPPLIPALLLCLACLVSIESLAQQPLTRAMPILGPSPVCVGSTQTYTTSYCPQCTDPSINVCYTWQVLQGGTIVGSNQQQSVVVNWNGSVSTGKLQLSIDVTANTVPCSHTAPGYQGTRNISITQLDIPYTIGPSPICINTPTPFNAYVAGASSYIWSANDPSVSISSGGSSNAAVTGSSLGNYSITVDATFCDGTPISYGQNITVTTSDCDHGGMVRVARPEISSSKVFPNPAVNVDYLNIELPRSDIPTPRTIRISDITGVSLIETHTSKNKISFDISSFVPGIYLVYISNSQAHKLIISKKLSNESFFERKWL